MNDQPQTAGSAESDLIESMLQRQEQVLTGLDDLFDRIDAMIGELTEQRKREAAEGENILSFGTPLAQEQPEDPVDQPSQAERAA